MMRFLWPSRQIFSTCKKENYEVIILSSTKGNARKQHIRHYFICEVPLIVLHVKLFPLRVSSLLLILNLHTGLHKFTRSCSDTVSDITSLIYRWWYCTQKWRNAALILEWTRKHVSFPVVAKVSTFPHRPVKSDVPSSNQVISVLVFKRENLN